MNSAHTVVVQFQFDADCPLLSATFKYRVDERETEIVFPSGKRKVFPNWDVKGCRERHYLDEWVGLTAEDYLRASRERGEDMEFGIAVSDVDRFIKATAQKPFYEHLFEKPELAQEATASA